MRILVYNWRDMAHPRAGGAEVYTENVARNWVQSGHEVTLFTSRVKGHPPVEDVKGIRIVRRGGRLGVYREARRFYEDEGDGRFDVVLDVVNTRPFLSPRFVRDVPVVALIFQVCREVWFYEAPLPAAVAGRYFLERRWLRLYRDTPVVTISESSRASLATYGLRDVSIVPVGFQGSEFSPSGIKEPLPTVLFVGRLSANKRPAHALKAVDRARDRLPDVQAWVVGSGPQADRLQKRHRHATTFFGRVSDIQKLELMSRAHVLVATSVREGWGMTITEAAAVGTPAIAYDVPGLRDSVNAAGGRLVPANPESLAESLIENVPKIGQSQGLRPTGGGVEPWNVVAESVLGHLTRATDRAPIHNRSSMTRRR